ncbi:MAG: yedY [Acidimicrobiales bacterium]|nr:yedY [Acidimicrobiales bacterium]
MSEPAEDRGIVGPSVTAAPAALAGLLGAATALVAIEVVTLFDATGVSVTEAVQNRFISEFASSLERTAIDWFGGNDKVALQVGTAIVVLALGALLGAAARRRAWAVMVGFDAFAVLGIVIAHTDPLASGAVPAIAAVVGAVSGAATTVLLTRWWSGAGLAVVTPAPAGPVPGAPVEGDPVGPSAALSRRTVLTTGGATALVLLFGVTAARGLRSSLRQGAAAISRVLPRAVRRVAVPAEQPFDVAAISPYLTPTPDFYRIDTALRVPVVDPGSWTLKITGMVDRELTFTYDQLLARDLVEVPITIACVSNDVGGELIGTARWTGVPLQELLDEAGVQDGADQIMGESVDGFTAGFPVEAGVDGRDSLLALGMGGRSLPAAHGFPARLIIPGLYGYVSATKWITEIRLTTFEAEQGFWVPRGWSADGPIKLQSRIDVPRSGDTLVAGRHAVGGVAWAPHTGIDGVQVSVDGGDWQAAELGRVASVDTWVQWRYQWDASPGEHEIAVRAIDADGKVQTAEDAPPAPDGATGHDTIGVVVEPG